MSCKSPHESAIWQGSSEIWTDSQASPLSDSAPASCHRCWQKFHDGEVYVALGGTYWHQGCFRCAQCLLPIALSDDYFELDGRFYCKHDFEVLYAPICTKCNCFVLGKIMRSTNSSFHPGCFKCECCSRKLDHGVWYVEGRMVCHDCKQLLPKTPHYKCTKCRQLIAKDDLLRFENDFFHAYHFSCVRCKVPLTGAGRQLDKDWLCPRCFDLSCETCAGCHKPIDKQRERSTLALGKSFHVEHFRCVKCEVAFNGRKHYERNGKAYCKEDFMALYSEFCQCCHRLLSGASVNILEKKWCVGCYRCLACDRVLPHSEQVFNLDMRPLCKKCHRRKDFRQFLKEGSHF